MNGTSGQVIETRDSFGNVTYTQVGASRQSSPPRQPRPCGGTDGTGRPGTHGDNARRHLGPRADLGPNRRSR